MRAITLLFLLFAVGVFGQPGFNRYYDLNSNSGGAFVNGTHDFVAETDKIHLIGVMYSPDVIGLQGIVFVEADTNGNILNTFPYFDVDQKNLAFSEGSDVIQLENGDIATCGGYLSEASLFLSIYRMQENSVYFRKIPLAGVTSMGVYDMTIYKNGFLIQGAVVNLENRIQTLLLHTDMAGNVIWELRYNLPGLDENSRCMKVLDENTIVVGAVSGVFFGPSPWNLSRIFAVDSLGILKWEWQSEEGYGLISDIEKLENGDWLFLQKRNVYPAPDSILAYNQLVRCDSNFNLIWEQRLRPTLWTNAYTNELHPTPDGHWIVSEKTALTGPDFTWTGAEGKAGCLTKVTSEGEILWQVCDSIHWDVAGAVSDEFVGGHVVLPSGSSILIGRTNRWQPSPPRSFGWMFKVDENGCMIESACATDVVEVVPEGNRLQIYPNPARDRLSVVFPTLTKSANLQIFNSLGRLEHTEDIETGITEKTLNISLLTPGFYSIRLNPDEGVSFTIKLIVQR